MKVGKAIVLYPLGPYKSCTIRADDCDNWKEANETLHMEYIKMREYLSEADQQD